MKPEDMFSVLVKIAEHIEEYTDHLFGARRENKVCLGFYMTEKGWEAMKRNVSDRAVPWMKKFLKNEDVSDWCRNRIFINGFPKSMTVYPKSIVVEGKAAVIFDLENYDDLKLKEEIFGMAQCIAHNGGDCYIVDLVENDNVVSASLTYSEPKKARKQW